MLSGDEATAVLDRQTAVMEQLAAGAPLADVLEGIVVALEELIAGSRCSVLLLDADGVLRHGAAPTLPRAYSDAIDGLEPGPLAGSCGTAVHLGTQVVAVDVSRDPRWEQFRELAVEHDIGACWSSPIRSESRIVGTLASIPGRRGTSPRTMARCPASISASPGATSNVGPSVTVRDVPMSPPFPDSVRCGSRVTSRRLRTRARGPRTTPRSVRVS